MAATTLLKRLAQRQANMEAKLIDQESWAHRENIRIYFIAEEEEGDNMINFVQKLLTDSMDLPPGMDLKRAHRTPT